MMAMRDVGITVLPEFFQVEGTQQVLSNLVRRADVQAIATSPYVMAPMPDGQGSREPPIDGGAGKVRLLDRPLFGGRRETWVRTAPSFKPDRALYHGLRYQPPPPDPLSAEGGVVRDALRAAKERGLAVHLQVQAAIPPGYRVQFGGPEAEDRPCLPDGSRPAAGVDNNGSLASPHILAYTQALIRDLVQAYPEIDVLRLDWPEYPPYAFDAVFSDFSGHAVAAMSADGFDVARMRRDVEALRLMARAWLAKEHDPDAAQLVAYEIGRWLQHHPGVIDWLTAKARIVTRFIAACSECVHQAAGGRIRLMPQSFPAPWNLVSGFDLRAVAAIPGIEAIGVKLYTMHWPMMLQAYLGPAPQGGHPRGVGAALASLLGLADDPGTYEPVERVHYPEPDEPHPAGLRAQAHKIAIAQAEAGGDAAIYAYAHGYGPVVGLRSSGRRSPSRPAKAGSGSTATATSATPSWTSWGSSARGSDRLR